MLEKVRVMLTKFLEEDVSWIDVTSELLIPKGIQVRAIIKAKEDGIMCGELEARELLSMSGLEVLYILSDGQAFRKGDAILEFKGDARKALTIERTLLNLLAMMCGIATVTRKAVELAHSVNSKVRVAATRKTLPGLRWFQKRAVMVGGGDPHRYDLSSMILIKDNHLSILGDVDLAVKMARARASFTTKIEVEVSNIDDALKAARAGADIIMLDNMSPSEISSVLESLKSEGLRDRVIVEASGGINMENLKEYAATGVDVISMGELTESIKPIDLSMDVERISKDVSQASI